MNTSFPNELSYMHLKDLKRLAKLQFLFRPQGIFSKFHQYINNTRSAWYSVNHHTHYYLPNYCPLLPGKPVASANSTLHSFSQSFLPATGPQRLTKDRHGCRSPICGLAITPLRVREL